MKKLSFGSLKAEFLKRDWRRRESSSSSCTDLAPTHPFQGQTQPPPLLTTSACGWASETQLAPNMDGRYSRSISDLRSDSGVPERLRFPDIWRVKRSTSVNENPNPNNKESSLPRVNPEKPSKPGIFDTLKRKFKGNFKIASNERAKLKQLSNKQKRNSISFSISSIAEEPHTSSCINPLCSASQCHCRLNVRRGSSSDGLGVPLRGAAGEDNIVLATPSIPSPSLTVISTDQLQRSAESCSSTHALRLHTNPNNNNSDLAWELFKLDKFGWYWGRLTRHEAEQKLADQPDGAFLVRDSSDDCHLLSLSFRCYGKTLHTRIEHTNGGFSFYAYKEAEYHGTVSELIEHLMACSRTGVFCYSKSRLPGSPSLPVRLTKPISRFSEVLPLQCLCRFVIRQYVRMDHVGALPLPERLKEYIVAGSS